MDIEKVKKFLIDLLNELKDAQEIWCDPEGVDDSEEMEIEYFDFIETTIPKIEDLLNE